MSASSSAEAAAAAAPTEPAETQPAQAEPLPEPATTAAPRAEAARAEKAASAPKPTGRRGLRFTGFVQAQFDTSQRSESELDASGEPLNYDRFYVRRARPRVDYDAEFAGATLELDANNVRAPTVGVRRAEVRLFYRKDDEQRPLIEFSAGILDLPFGYELGESARARPFFERSTGSLAIFPTEMDAGVRVSGAVAFFRYGVSLSNGEPVSASGFPRDPNKAKDITGRFGVEVPLDFGLTLAGGTSFATGKGFHRGQPATKASVSWRDDNQNGTVDAGELIGVPASAATPSQDFERWAFGLDFQARLNTRLGESRLYAEGFLASNYDRGLYTADPVVTGVDVREANLSLSLVQDVTRYGLVGFRYAHYDPNSDLLEQRQGELLPRSATVSTISPLLGLEIDGLARLVFQYDVVLDHLARDSSGVPSDAKNNQFGVRLQGEF